MGVAYEGSNDICGAGPAERGSGTKRHRAAQESLIGMRHMSRAEPARKRGQHFGPLLVDGRNAGRS